MLEKEQCSKENLFDTIKKVAEKRALQNTVFEVNGFEFEVIMRHDDENDGWKNETTADSDGFTAEQKTRLVEVLTQDNDLMERLRTTDAKDEKDPSFSRYVSTEEDFMKIYNEAFRNEKV